jgi:hypothetical protein
MIVICGKQALIPVDVARVCRENPHERVYALPWVTTPEELQENLKVNHGKPSRMLPCAPNKEEAEGEKINFYERLKDDAFGVMADALKHGTPILNETMTCPCENAFYGCVLVPKWIPGASTILRCKSIDTFFPYEPISAKLYAMTTVPVMLRNTDAFRKETGCLDEEMPVMLATDFIPRIVTFMRFHKLFTGRDWVFSVPPDKFPGRPPFRWRYNRAYRVI